MDGFGIEGKENIIQQHLENSHVTKITAGKQKDLRLMDSMNEHKRNHFISVHLREGC